MQIEQIKKQLADKKVQILLQESKKKELEDKILLLSQKIKRAEDNRDLYVQTKEFLSAFTNESRAKLKEQLEQIVSSVLQRVVGEEYSFKIEFVVKRGVDEAVFTIYDDNAKSNVDILESSGGGLADIVSVILLFVFLGIHSTNGGYLILDEAGKFLHGQEFEERFFELVKELTKSYNRQTIYVTAIESLINVADNVIKIEKNNGYTEVV